MASLSTRPPPHNAIFRRQFPDTSMTTVPTNFVTTFFNVTSFAIGPCGAVAATYGATVVLVGGGTVSVAPIPSTLTVDVATCIKTPRPCPGTLSLEGFAMCTWGTDYSPTPVDGTFFSYMTVTTSGIPDLQNGGVGVLVTYAAISAPMSTATPSQAIPLTPTSSQTAHINVSASSGLSTGAKAGIGVGVAGGVLAILIATIILLLKKRRKRKIEAPQDQPPYEKGIDNPQTKPELAGSVPANTLTYDSYQKPELATRAKTITESTSTSSRAGAELQSSSTQDMITPSNTSTLPPISSQADINTMEAQERELAHKIEVNDKLQQLKAEHAALQERIRMAEMQARELEK